MLHFGKYAQRLGEAIRSIQVSIPLVRFIIPSEAGKYVGMDCQNPLHAVSLLGNKVHKRDVVIIAEIRINVARHS
jgi:hypothetical protein